MKKLVECVPNISEGRDLTIIDTLSKMVDAIEEVSLLDRHIDPDHHRTVFTIAGAPEGVLNAAFELVRTVAQIIDLSEHRGGHPRVGAVDVIPFIPLRAVTMIDCIDLAKRLGSKIGTELDIPVFLYGEASLLSPRRQLEMIRRGGWKGLSERMTSDSEWESDFGPLLLHSTAGAVAVGARDFLIAYNVLLQTDDLFIAKSVAKTIRTSGGGLPSLKAMGVALPSRGLVQVSMNLTNYRETSIADAYSAVQQEAARHGIDIEESELVGLVPQAAVPVDLPKSLKFRSWNPDQILENRLAQVGFSS